MVTKSESHCYSYGWLDSLAIGMSMLCAVHCLLTPVLVISLPILATTFWIHQDFHLWMILLVLPTTTLAVFLGCRKHKDKLVFLLSAIGLSLLTFIALQESVFHSNLILQDQAHCAHCAAKEAGNLLTGQTAVNVLGGFLLASAHVRNYLLCRKAGCTHDS